MQGRADGRIGPAAQPLGTGLPNVGSEPLLITVIIVVIMIIGIPVFAK